MKTFVLWTRSAIAGLISLDVEKFEVMLLLSGKQVVDRSTRFCAVCYGEALCYRMM